jgi:sugar phosphate isomerase/epimerase
MKFGPSPFTYELVMNLISSSGLESLGSFSISDHVEQALKMGFNHFDIGLDIFQTFLIPISPDDIVKLHALKQKYNISYSCHLPFFSLDLAVSNAFTREGSQKAFIHAYQTVQDLETDIECFVLHPIGENTTEILKFIGDSPVTSEAIEMFTQFAIHGIQVFLEETGLPSHKLAIENVEFPLEPTLQIVRATNTKFCLDTAHLLGGMSGSWDLCEVLTHNYDSISEIHLQDYNNSNPMSDHAALGTSGLFPKEFIKKLMKNKFSGPLVFELSYEDIIHSCRYLQENFPTIEGLPKF